MIAHVLPLRAMPRGLDFFTYLVPPELHSLLALGHCVKIPFRNQTLLGIVVGIEHTTKPNLKSILEIINETPLLDATYVQFLSKLARFYGVSAATIFKLALPPLQPTKINHEPLEPWRTPVSRGLPAEYTWYRSTTEQQAAYARYESERLLIVVPQKNDLLTVQSRLSATRQAECVLWSSDLSIKAERELWFKIRNGHVRTMVATRSALWLPIHQSFDRLVIDYEHDQNHKHYDQSPRFTSKDLAKMQVRHFGLAYAEMSYSPSVTSYYFIQNKNYTLTTATSAAPSSPRLISPDASFERTPLYRPTVTAIHEALAHAPHQDQIFLYNASAAPKNGICHDCRQIINTPLPDYCPNCGGQNMHAIGYTVSSIAKWLQKEFPNQTVLTITKADELIVPSNQGRLIVGTKALFNLIDWSNISLAVMLDFTRQAMFSEYLTHEDLRHLIRQFQFFLPTPTPFLIQALSTDHPILTTLTTDEPWYTTELNNRYHLGYPPYSYLVRYLVPGTTPEAAESLAQAGIQNLMARLTKTPKQLMIQGPLPASTRNQGKDWSVVMIKVQESDILSAVTWCHESFSPKTKIDPNPISLTSPH